MMDVVLSHQLQNRCIKRCLQLSNIATDDAGLQRVSLNNKIPIRSSLSHIKTMLQVKHICRVLFCVAAAIKYVYMKKLPWNVSEYYARM